MLYLCMDCPEFISNLKNSEFSKTVSSICFWGHLHKFQKESQVFIADVIAEEEKLIFLFSDKSKLTLLNPGELKRTSSKIIIQQAVHILYEWNDVSPAGQKKNKFYLDFNKQLSKIIGKNNIHWSVIDAKDLSIKNAALIIAK
jgi:hypothetical protein